MPGKWPQGFGGSPPGAPNLSAFRPIKRTRPPAPNRRRARRLTGLVFGYTTGVIYIHSAFCGVGWGGGGGFVIPVVPFYYT